MQVEAAKNRFNKEANRPYEDIKNLEDALEPHRTYQEKLNIQDLEQKREQDAQKMAVNAGTEVLPLNPTPYINPSVLPSEDIYNALKAYGIDINSSVNQWHKKNKGNSYTVQQVADMPPDLQQAHNKLTQLHPSNPDSYTNQRKAGLRDLVNSEPMGNQIARHVPQSVQPQIDRLERDAKRNLKGKLNTISSQFIQLNQHGSKQHQAEAARKARELNEQLMQMRNQIIEGALRNEANIGADETKVKMRKAGEMGQQRLSLFNDQLANINNQNFSGMQQFHNAQNALDRQYRTQEENEQYKWPHLRELIRGGQLPVKMLNRDNSQYE